VSPVLLSVPFKTVEKIKIIECYAELIAQHQLQRSCLLPLLVGFFALVLRSVLLFETVGKIKIMECYAETVSQHQLQRS